MSKDEAAKGGGGEKGGGRKGKLTLLIVFLIALIGGGYLTYRDLVTPFSPVQVTVVGRDADVDALPDTPSERLQSAERSNRPAPDTAPPSATPRAPAPGPGSRDAIAQPEPAAPAETAPDETGSAAAVGDDRPAADESLPAPGPAPDETAAPPAPGPAPDEAAGPAEETTETASVGARGADAGAAVPESAGDEVAPPKDPARGEAASAPPTGDAGSPADSHAEAPENDPARTGNTRDADPQSRTAEDRDPQPRSSRDADPQPRTGGDSVSAALMPPAPQGGGETTVPRDDSGPSLSVEAVPVQEPDPDAQAVVQPSFDIVRIDSVGDGLVAGRAQPGTTVQIMSGDSVIATAEVSEGGEFVAFIQTPAADEGQVLSLAASEGVSAATGSESVLILPSPGEDDEPTIVKATDDEVRIVQASPLGRVAGVTLDSISYDQSGAVMLAGRAPRAQPIRVYVDGAPEAVTRSSEAGTWDARLETVEAGRYVLRVDALAEDGTVESRAESPFQRVYPTADQVSGPTQITVQPGNTLWVMAREKYGSGLYYTQIFAANQDAIRDPDLIYPGQIFTLPSETEVQR